MLEPPIRWVTLPNSATAATWESIPGGSGLLNPQPGLSEVNATAADAAPSEYPPITSRVSGHRPAMSWMRELMSLAPWAISTLAG